MGKMQANQEASTTSLHFVTVHRPPAPSFAHYLPVAIHWQYQPHPSTTCPVAPPSNIISSNRSKQQTPRVQHDTTQKQSDISSLKSQLAFSALKKNTRALHPGSHEFTQLGPKYSSILCTCRVSEEGIITISSSSQPTASHHLRVPCPPPPPG